MTKVQHMTDLTCMTSSKTTINQADYTKRRVERSTTTDTDWIDEVVSAMVVL